MNQTARAYARLNFDKWWKRNQKGRAEHSKYLARKAFIAAWFQSLAVVNSSEQ